MRLLLFTPGVNDVKNFHHPTCDQTNSAVSMAIGAAARPIMPWRQARQGPLVNLAVNAIKYAPERTRIRLATGRRGGTAVFEVADEDPGLAPEHRERLFESFYRVDKSRSREMGGTGLGLALVKWAAEAHGGRVELETEVGRGSTFRIVLPSGPPRNGP